MRIRLITKNFTSLYIIGVVTLLFAGCKHSHEEEIDLTPVHTKIVLLPGADMTPLNISESATRGESEEYEVRYIIEVYDNESSDNNLLFRKEILRPEGDTGEVALECDLQASSYRMVAWRDFVPVSIPADCYYTTGNLSAVKLKGEHVGCVDYKDVFSGTTTFTLTASDKDYRAEMQLERPLAKVEFITTDIIKYLNKLERSVSVRASVVEQMTVRLNYAGYFPVGFDVLLDRPNETVTGIHFNSTIVPLSEREARLAFDYVFVNGTESAIDVEMVIYNGDGVEVNRVSGIHVPICRNRITTVRDEFLTRDYAPGIGIRPDFDGEINIVLP